MSDRLSTLQSDSSEDQIGFDDLQVIADRFRKFHHFKRESIRHVLTSPQRQFLDALPLVLDINDPALPGFVSPATPAGIYGYRPDKRALEAARQIGSGFSYRPQKRNNGKAAIDGLFLMGSAGSIAFTLTSDMDVWLCHRSGLTAPEFDELQKKVQAIENWAASLHLEVHFFLINSEQFLLARKKPVSADSSGETQHYLLLEEFYRTSVYIAGKDLAWWLVPPWREHDYPHYLAYLVERRMIDADRILDLGGLAAVPANEFLGATQWHVYKALHSPYKSLLKLSLMECYASEYPHVNWLCSEIKRAVYEGELTGPRTDPYVLLYLRLEDYLLKSQSPTRLALIRQFFYRKINTAGGNLGQTGTLPAGEDYFREISLSWRLQDPPPAAPIEPDAWGIEELLAENTLIISQLTLCYNKIIQLIYDHIQSEIPQKNDIKLLARKLSAFFEPKHGKVEIITASGNELPVKPDLTIVEDRSAPKNPEWRLFCGRKNRQNAALQIPIYRRSTLIELLCWVSVNKFYRQDTPVRCNAESIHPTCGELNALLEHLDGFFKNYFDFSDSLGNYAAHNSLTHSLLIINIGQTPQTETGRFAVPVQGNPLSCGASRECLVETVDRVSVNHWNEILTRHEQGIEGLCNCLIEIVNETLQSGDGNRLSVVCEKPGHDRRIIQHIERLFEDLRRLHRSGPENPAPRYFMAGSGRYFVFSRQNGLLQYQQADDEARLIEILSSPRKLYGSVTFDAEVLEETPIPAIYRENLPHTVQCFILQENNGARIYVLDEKGSLYIRRHSDAATVQLVNQYARFLHSLLARKTTEAASMQFYQIDKRPETGWQCRPVPFHLPMGHDQNPLSISGTCLGSADLVTVRWNGEEFNSRQYGNRLFQTVSERIIEFRKNGQTYPVYITELNLSPSAFGLAGTDALQTLHFLEYKEKIEAQLNGKR
ncbi:class I adenylate cyclase [Methylomicrobium sp. RS1]|uniref:class I adenylate cyclase n=1 Tax=Candidatus Methylomicrobium oryzae TaxID=2802053 RepID=UPI0019209230|nr:class I adenylate cyclase [Methylomicrobium sp. RS1]